jgi:hypothetical protein
VLYGPPHADGSLNPIWAADTDHHPSDALRVQDNGNVVIYQSGHPIWSTHTAGIEANLYLTPVELHQQSGLTHGKRALCVDRLRPLARSGREPATLSLMAADKATQGYQ